ncbi:MAG: phosphate ABC transporter substrate-binding protein PstS [Zetaproteobacteria bacterium CG12_big_fil_rev_8_21_14_0_65_55_1124]|nr:MAG: phosphate ABC transporter substrate-binding protein PstS [Zetaproteobacteria bacterium CG1_02_55_237]PIS19627.1 MAG: phosphate ABC transporter substrate-binding protein PstS [Zetaproteobacteria bacterium CG08_land_8_20_14_0_20_55_17]PIW41969.1 MAG: phosphate ABC transporter substrate-binding protein PstS [Zetaproteobacteria bacterium CG12_big_fil_rev_8_21_14_0_65_55_1124]PIY53847.1 MAG: phosphate ABC transporter substrate-binding protein PstS [Zetaproteobacteria bacterium CG_4_10_14_0_8_
MKKMIFAAAMIVAGAMGAASTAQAGASITGAGATFPYPVYSKWADTYNKETDVRLNYQSIGSGGGIKQIKAKTVDFGASDAPMKPADLNKFGLIQWPMVMGGVVPVVNIAGVASGQLKLSAENMADIFLGNIRYWNDKKIQANNPDLKLPEQGITVVHRSDGSGTTWIFTNYLSKISNNWKDNVGNNKSVQWPVGLGGKGNEGVAAYVKRIDGSIGYVEYAYALQNQMTAALLQNQAGNYVAPTAANFQAAAAGADWAHAEGYYMVLTAQPGANSWPITGASFILMYKSQDNAAQAKEVLKFFEYSFKNGSQAAMDLDYVPMPEAVVKMVEATWASELKDTSGKAIWK